MTERVRDHIMMENSVDPLELMLLECVDEIDSLKYKFRSVIIACPDYSMLLSQERRVARKLLRGYRSETVDKDIIISALNGITHFVGRIREDLESLERKQKGNRIANFFRRIIKTVAWLTKTLK